MPEVAALALENFRLHAIFPSRGIPGARIEESRALTWLDSGLDTDTLNLVLGSRLDAGSVPARANEVVAHFERVHRPFSWWVSPGDEPEDLGERLTAEGLALEEWELAMSCPLDRLRPAPPVPGLEIQRVATVEALAVFARISAENWTPADALVERYYARASDRLLETVSPLRSTSPGGRGPPSPRSRSPRAPALSASTTSPRASRIVAPASAAHSCRRSSGGSGRRPERQSRCSRRRQRPRACTGAWGSRSSAVSRNSSLDAMSDKIYYVK